ncbi:MAG: phosphatase PAP2 family protein [Bacteroidota bacterium]
MHFIKDNKAFFALHTLLLLLGSYPLFVYNKVELALQLNSYHHPWADAFFALVTHLGSSKAYILFLLTLVVLRQSNRILLLGGSSFVAMSLLVQSLKRIPIIEQLRPIKLIPADVAVHLVKGVVPQTIMSFPSGHAGTIFTAVCVIHFLIPKKPLWCTLVLLLVASIVAYSRVYLLHHFYRDVYVGALIGVWSTTAVYTLLKHWQGPAWLRQTPQTLWQTLKKKARE